MFSLPNLRKCLQSCGWLAEQRDSFNSCFLLVKVAAGTLDASTKIYAVRVDAVHADAYRVLGGLGAETKPGEGKNLSKSSSSVCLFFIFIFLKLDEVSNTKDFLSCLHLQPTLLLLVKTVVPASWPSRKWWPSSRRRRGLPRGRWSRT